jgi:predicted metal-dependent hydrolase
MSHKSARIAERVAALAGRARDPRYLGFFDCFNRQEFYEAHDVLEDLWLPDRRGPDGNFYKGLIQLAGAFVHVQKGRLQPAGALLRLACQNLAAYPRVHHGLDLVFVRKLAGEWEVALAARSREPRSHLGAFPQLPFPD